MSDRLSELAAVGYGAFRLSCGELDPSNGCRMATFEQLPSRVQGGWRDGVRAVLEDVYRDQEAAKAAAVPEAVAPVLKPVEVPAVEPAGHSATRKPRK